MVQFNLSYIAIYAGTHLDSNKSSLVSHCYFSEYANKIFKEKGKRFAAEWKSFIHQN